MNKFWNALKRGAKAFTSANDPQGFTVGSRDVQCPHCGQKVFVPGSVQLNTPGMTFIGLDWANRSAHTLMCTECSCIQWFLERPEPSGGSASGS